MKRRGSFIIHILSQENSTWQGQITWLDKSQTQNFRSMLEMIKLLDTAVSTSEGDTGITETKGGK